MQLFLIDHDQAIPCRRLPGGALAEVDHGRYAKRMDEPVRRLAVVGVLPPCRPREARHRHSVPVMAKTSY